MLAQHFNAVFAWQEVVGAIYDMHERRFLSSLQVGAPYDGLWSQLVRVHTLQGCRDHYRDTVDHEIFEVSYLKPGSVSHSALMSTIDVNAVAQEKANATCEGISVDSETCSINSVYQCALPAASLALGFAPCMSNASPVSKSSVDIANMTNVASPV
jgi:hypothetical protein